jgi:hypothetical protein
MKMKLDRGCWALLAAVAIMAAPLAAAGGEQAVGLEAQGVDPWVALRPGGLDVRDELGRPVRAGVIEAQLKAVNAEAAVQASFSSRLPKAGAVIRMLELLQALTAWFGAALPSSGSRPLWALAPAPPSPQKSLFLVLLACLTTALSRKFRFQSRPATQSAACGASCVLRC